MTRSYSAGILVYDSSQDVPKIFLGHPGGPYNKNAKWSILKGKMELNEAALDAAIREFREESGFDFLMYPFTHKEIKPVTTLYGKNKTIVVLGFDIAPYYMAKSPLVGEILNTSEMKSDTCQASFHGRNIIVPEIDAYGWFPTSQARTLIHNLQLPLVDWVENICGVKR